jgi:hypothetical protein
MIKIVAVIILLLTVAMSAQASPPPCDFSRAVSEQALCLLRPVEKFAHIGKTLPSLPTPLNQIIGQPVEISKQVFRQYLQANAINENDLGGNIDQQLSKTQNGETAQYFIFHDTSTPLPKTLKVFPDKINQKEWNGNNLKSYQNNAHVFINRLGDSVTKVDFKVSKLTTKFERENKTKRVGLFLGIELVQPRLIDARGSDAVAPESGFTEPQLKRLALVYIAASLRKESWLIPAYHAVIDSNIVGGHDDPQHFDLTVWSDILGKTIEDIKKTK